MDSSHSSTDLKGAPSLPLELGRRIETLWGKYIYLLNISINSIVDVCNITAITFMISSLLTVSYRGSILAMSESDSGLLNSFSSKLTISTKRGRLERSCVQH